MWDANLATAFGEGVAKVYEFGGGIGPGEPTEKRPNLEGMIKKASRSLDPKPEYAAVINAASLANV